MFHGATNRHFVVNTVAKTGRSLNLAKGQWAVVDKDAQATNDGLKIVSDFNGMAKNHNVQLFHGTPDISARSFSNKANRSYGFKIGDIQEVRVSAPKEGIKVDEQILGYNGHDADSAIVLEAGDDKEIQLRLSGPALGILGYPDQEVVITERLTAPNGTKSLAASPAAGTWTDHQVVEEAVERLNRTVVMGSVQLSDYVEITPVNSEAGAASGTDTVFYNLTVSDSGTHTDLGAVQAQYPSLSVKRTDTLSYGSVYTVIAPKSVVTAGSFTTGEDYIIVTTGNTDFTAIGAADSLPGTRFTATGAGTGTGTASLVTVDDFQINKAWLVKGCADCPSGYSEYEDGFIYSVKIEDDGADSTAAVEAISANIAADSAVQVNQEGGFSTYTAISSAELTEGEISTFVTANPEAEVVLVARDVAEVCSPDNIESIAWEEGNTCKVKTETYSIIVGHDECDTAPTAEINAAYPELTITTGASANCSTKYTTTVTTNVVCEECSPQFRGLFTSEAPADFGVHAWQKADKTYNGEALMGIRFKAKPFIFAGSEEYRDSIPELATSTRIQVAGGYSLMPNQSFEAGSPEDVFNVTILSVASEPENWGLNLRDWEEASRIAFMGECRFYDNNYGNLVTGKETNLEAIQPYVDYIIKVKTNTSTQGFNGIMTEVHEYHMIVAPGVHKDVEDVVNALALQAGLTQVQAFGNTAA